MAQLDMKKLVVLVVSHLGFVVLGLTAERRLQGGLPDAGALHLPRGHFDRFRDVSPSSAFRHEARRAFPGMSALPGTNGFIGEF